MSTSEMTRGDRVTARHEERVAFCVAHPGGAFDERVIRLLAERLSRGPEALIDVTDAPRGGRLVLCLVEGADSEADAAELVVLGALGPPEAQVALLLDQVDGAVARAREGPRACLDVVLRSKLAGAAGELEARGFAIAYTAYEMAARSGTVFTTAPPEGLRFADVDAAAAAQARDFLDAAFAGVPGFMGTPEDEMVSRMLAHRPPVRVLLDASGRLEGFVRVGAPDAEGVGYIQLIARGRHRRGQRLGDVLLGEAERVLASLGARRFALDVVSVNEDALRLYRRHGFEVTGLETAWRLPLVR